ncbi:hypothetical protein [Chitinophaga agri]|uniref:Oligosaccharide repeat unit polymerase n=1 Tax=Chitinophaga agri TaxID=2703787 RepID=A0A6B9Z7M1_9BACT|nr:hypothetical protein [Chitinophaga agri]QHS58238.1 hypothetical protein GWR21_01100 [Chitinophaga agri]
MKNFFWPILILLLYILQAYDKMIGEEFDINFYLFGVIIFYSAYKAFNDPYIYSLNMFFWIFNLIFLGYTASFQYLTNDFPWGGSMPKEVVFETNIYIIIGLSLYDLVYSLYKPRIKINSLFAINYPKFNFAVIGTIIFAAVWLYTYFTTGIQFTRFDLVAQSKAADVSQDQGLLVGIISRSLLAFYCILCVHFMRQQKISPVWGLLVLGLTILICFPTTISRNYAGILYLGIILNYFRTFKWQKLIPLSFITIFILFFPILTHARYDYFTLDFVLKNYTTLTATAYKSGDFDAYSMFCRSVNYVEQHDLTYGRQLMGALLFFVPRSMWPAKPFGSGYFVGDSHGLGFLNVSCPFMAEGFINFGLIGTLLFILLLALLSRYMDQFYWTNISRGNLHNFWIVLYPSLIGSFIFVLRGDLLSSMAYTTGLLASALVFHCILKFMLKGT